jgi:hypothetical protein
LPDASRAELVERAECLVRFVAPASGAYSVHLDGTLSA